MTVYLRREYHESVSNLIESASRENSDVSLHGPTSEIETLALSQSRETLYPLTHRHTLTWTESSLDPTLASHRTPGPTLASSERGFHEL